MTPLRRLATALRRLLGRPEPTTFQRCLAVHVLAATLNRSALR